MEKIKFYWQKFDLTLKNSNLPSFLKHRFIWLTLIVLIVITIFTTTSGISAEATEVPVFKVKHDNLLVSITESGEIRAKSSQSVSSPRIRGNLKIIFLVPEGTYVAAGDTVVKFDPTESLNNLRTAESELEMAQSEKDKLIANQKSTIAQKESSLKSAELSFELSKLNLEQMKFEAEAKQSEARLQHEKNQLSYDQVKQEYESTKIIHQSELNEMGIKIKQKMTELEKVQRELDMMTLTAPEPGLVVYGINWANNSRKFAVGDTPWSNMVIITLPDLSSMESVTQVNEVDVSKVKAGQRVDVKLDAFQDSTFEGVISNVASLGKNKEGDSQIKVFEILVDITGTSEILKPGMTTSNKIILNQIDNVLFIPIESVFERNGKKVAFVKSGGGFDETEITTGEKGEDYIVITSGIEEGDEVALLDPYESNGTDESNDSNVEIPE